MTLNLVKIVLSEVVRLLVMVFPFFYLYRIFEYALGTCMVISFHSLMLHKYVLPEFHFPQHQYLHSRDVNYNSGCVLVCLVDRILQA